MTFARRKISWQPLTALGPKHLRGRDYLANVALGVVGDMNERAADGCGQLFAADEARRFEIGCCQNTNALAGISE